MTQSAKRGKEDEFISFNREYLQSFLDEKSERTVVGLSLLSHSFRLENWDLPNIVILCIQQMKMVHFNEYWSLMIDKACKLLSDQRVTHLISRITDLNQIQVKQIITEPKFLVHFVDLNAFVPVKGWVTPVGIAINIRQLSELEKTNIMAFSRIIGHELTHFISRVSNSNFSMSTPERAQNSTSLKDLILELKTIHPDIDRHIESGLLFELGFIGETFSYQDHDSKTKELCDELEQAFSNQSKSLPLLSASQNKYCTLEFNEQFGFYPSIPVSFNM